MENYDLPHRLNSKYKSGYSNDLEKLLSSQKQNTSKLKDDLYNAHKKLNSLKEQLDNTSRSILNYKDSIAKTQNLTKNLEEKISLNSGVRKEKELKSKVLRQENEVLRKLLSDFKAEKRNDEVPSISSDNLLRDMISSKEEEILDLKKSIKALKPSIRSAKTPPVKRQTSPRQVNPRYRGNQKKLNK